MDAGGRGLALPGRATVRKDAGVAGSCAAQEQARSGSWSSNAGGAGRGGRRSWPAWGLAGNDLLGACLWATRRRKNGCPASSTGSPPACCWRCCPRCLPELAGALPRLRSTLSQWAGRRRPVLADGPGAVLAAQPADGRTVGPNATNAWQHDSPRTCCRGLVVLFMMLLPLALGAGNPIAAVLGSSPASGFSAGSPTGCISGTCRVLISLSAQNRRGSRSSRATSRSSSWFTAVSATVLGTAGSWFLGWSGRCCGAGCPTRP